MRLITYDRGGARRLGAWVGEAVVDLPDAVGHPAFPSTMEALVARHGGTTMDAARAAVEHPDVARYSVSNPRLLMPIAPASVRTVPDQAVRPPNQRYVTPSGNGLEVACVLGSGGVDLSIQEAADAIFGYSLVTAVTLGPTIVTADEIDPSNPRFFATIDGHPFEEATFDTARLAAVIARTSIDEELHPGDIFIFHTAPGHPTEIRRRRVRSDALFDLDAPRAGVLGKLAGSR
jgi:2-keto-4-pentenoate hydratase/2-oxohepta-3-ene-1,7-dioic acid hydratase in catechol pathway